MDFPKEREFIEVIPLPDFWEHEPEQAPMSTPEQPAEPAEQPAQPAEVAR